MFNKNANNLLTIDLSPEAVRLLQVRLRRGAPLVTAIASAPLETGETETLPERHLAALSSALQSQRIKGSNCVATVPSNLVTTRSVMIDPAKPQSPEEQIQLTLQNILSYDSRDLLFDFWSTTQLADSNKAYEVLVVATQRSVVHKYLEGFKKLKLNCSHLDVAPCAIAEVIARLAPQQDAIVGTVALTETLGYFAVVEKQRVLFWRPFDVPAPKGNPQAALERIGDEISKCVSHMVGTLHLDTAIDIFLFGNGAQDDVLGPYLAERFNFQTKAPSPFEILPEQAVPADVRALIQPAMATHFAAALGLALQPAGGLNG